MECISAWSTLITLIFGRKHKNYKETPRSFVGRWYEDRSRSAEKKKAKR